MGPSTLSSTSGRLTFAQLTSARRAAYRRPRCPANLLHCHTKAASSSLFLESVVRCGTVSTAAVTWAAKMVTSNTRMEQSGRLMTLVKPAVVYLAQLQRKRSHAHCWNLQVVTASGSPRQECVAPHGTAGEYMVKESVSGRDLIYVNV